MPCQRLAPGPVVYASRWVQVKLFKAAPFTPTFSFVVGLCARCVSAVVWKCGWNVRGVALCAYVLFFLHEKKVFAVFKPTWNPCCATV